MDTVINYLRELLGSTNGFWHLFESTNSYNSYNWDYGMLFEYFIAGVIVCIVITNAFKFLRDLVR